MANKLPSGRKLVIGITNMRVIHKLKNEGYFQTTSEGEALLQRYTIR
jgi:hypothetical protein